MTISTASEWTCQVSHQIDGRKLFLYTPYNPVVISACRKAGGKWNADKKAWCLHVDAGTALVGELFGLSDKLCLVRIEKRDKTGETVKPGWYDASEDCALSCEGYLLAYRKSRDYAADLYADLVQGSIPSWGGSTKHPAVAPSDDAIFELVVRLDFAERHGLEIVEAQETESNAPQPIIETHGVKLFQHGPDLFTVQYHKQVKNCLDYASACHEFGECVFHSLSCEGLIDNRTMEEADNDE